MEAEVTKLKYKSEFSIKHTVFLIKINQKELQPLCYRAVFPFPEITEMQELGLQEKQTVGTEEKDLKDICDIALKNSL